MVTTRLQYKKKIVDIWNRLPELKFVLLTDIDKDLQENVVSLARLMAKASPEFTIPPTDPEDMSCLHFTSGTTGMPKGAIHVHKAVLVHYMTAKYALDMHENDIFWCTADPGWVTGTSYGVIAPLLHGVTNIVDEAEFDVNVTAPEGASIAAMDDVIRSIEKDLRAIRGVRLILSSVGGSFLGNINQGSCYVRIAPHEERIFSLPRFFTSLLRGRPLDAFRNNYSQKDVMLEVRRTPRG